MKKKKIDIYLGDEYVFNDTSGFDLKKSSLIDLKNSSLRHFRIKSSWPCDESWPT